MSAHDDLALIREFISLACPHGWDSSKSGLYAAAQEAAASLGRVEAELVELEQRANFADAYAYRQRAEAAEAELARLRGYLDITRGERDEWARRNEAAEAENADLLNRLEISGALRKEAEAENARLQDKCDRMEQSLGHALDERDRLQDGLRRIAEKARDGLFPAHTLTEIEALARALLGSTEDTAP